MCCPADAPTDDISGEHVDDERHINEPGPCRDIGKIRDPQPVGSWRLELAIDPIERAWSALVADGRALWLAADDALQAEARMSRSIVQRATEKPSRRICRQIFRTP